MEIPACKGFMMAESTEEHKRLFEENVEAVYFANNDELLKKVNYYLLHDDQRISIAKNGHKRCLQSEYSYDDMVNNILKELKNYES